MKNLFKTGLALTLTLFLITSCSKNKDVIDQKEKAITETEMQNKANPYDEQGVLYNGFLNAIQTDSTDPWHDFDAGNYLVFNNDIGGWDVGKLSMSDTGGIGGWDVGKILSFAMAVNEDNGKESDDQAYKNLSMQLEAISGLKMIDIESECWYHPSRCKSLINPVQILEPSNGGTAHDRTIKYIQAVRDLEAKIQADDKINQTDKRDLLVCYSIARHAAGYWFNQNRNGDEPVGEIMVNIIHLSTLGASTALAATDTEEVGVGTAILNAYIATGRTN